MHETYLKTIRNVFSKYRDFIIKEISDEDSVICIDFTFHEKHLNLYIFEPNNNYLRSISVCVDDYVADDLKIPAHYIQHNEKDKLCTLCLLDREQHILSNCSLDELIDIYLGQTQSLLLLSPKQKEYEYLKEFEFYWNAASGKNKNSGYAEIYLPETEIATLLNCWNTKDNSSDKNIIFPENTLFNSSNNPKGSKTTAVYIPIEFPNGVTPPQNDIPWSAVDLLNIVCNPKKDRISPASYEYLNKLQIENYKKIVVFSFSQPESVEITIAGTIYFSNNKRKDFISKIQEDFQSFVPMKSSRMDMRYLHERVGQLHNDLPPILLVGCGSVGSYVLPELVNVGFTEIGISDPDVFASGNSLRHYLGPRSNGNKKTLGMQLFMEFENPLVSINIVPNLLDLDCDELNKTLSRYKIIIIAVGGTDLQRKFNYILSKTKHNSWFIYNWLDAEGKGAHALAMRYTHKGCYNCLFNDDGKLKVSFANGSEKVIGNGCGGSFSPYGNNVLIRNNTLVISVLQSILNGSITKNTIASIKNDFSTLESSISIVPQINNNFSEERCDICGHI